MRIRQTLDCLNDEEFFGKIHKVHHSGLIHLFKNPSLMRECCIMRNAKYMVFQTDQYNSGMILPKIKEYNDQNFRTFKIETCCDSHLHHSLSVNDRILSIDKFLKSEILRSMSILEEL